MQKRRRRTQAKEDDWPKKVTLGRVSVSVYRRQTPLGNPAYMVANYSDGRRRFDSYPTADEALEAADNLARKLSERDVLAAAMTNEQASDYASAIQALAPHSVSLPSAASTLADCLNLVGDLPTLHAAAKDYAQHHRRVERKRVSAVVAELLTVKEARGASRRYMEDLRARLNRFADAMRKDACNVTTADVQAWLDALKLKPRNYVNFRRVIHTLFEFAVARGYALRNPVAGVEKLEVGDGDIQVFTPTELSRLLAAASPEILPCITLGAFAGLRSAEIERLEWSDIHLAERYIVIGAAKAKTASRRVVPVCDALAAWLAPLAGQEGLVWKGAHPSTRHDAFYDALQATAAATAAKQDRPKGINALKPVKWKPNGLRHSYASYRFAEISDAGRVAGELGNSASIVHRHYRELVKPADAKKWFSVHPDLPANVRTLPKTATA